MLVDPFNDDDAPPALEKSTERLLLWVFALVLLVRFFFPFVDSPLSHLFSDPLRHWNNGRDFLTPGITGGQDPFLYQLWLYSLQTCHSRLVISVGTGTLCTLMPYGWYRALRELMPKIWALGGGIAIGIMPGFIAIYAYFMNETLLLTLTGFAVWLSLGALRQKTIPRFSLACLLWLLAGFTRSIALPMGLVTLAYIWICLPHKFANAAVGVAMLTALAVPAGLHARQSLHYFAPFGNFYFNDIYRASGKKEIILNFGPAGQFFFGCPSFYNPTFYPFWSWTTGRTGIAAIRVDLTKGKADWIAEEKRVAAENSFPFWKDFTENFLDLSFGQAWPDNNRSLLADRLTLWTRWLWPIIILIVAYGACKRRFRGREWLLPGLGLGMFLFLMLQRDCMMEARFRTPIDPFYIVSLALMLHRRKADHSHSIVPGGFDVIS